MATSNEPRRLTIPVMTAFGFGQLGEALVTIGFTTFLLYFYNQVLGVSGTITGIALAISLVVDAVVDPIAGSLSDRLRSRWGRRHPYILLSAVPLAGCFFLIFNPPDGFNEIELAAWLVVWTLAARIALTFYHVPHLALGAEMAHDYNQRSTMYSYNTLFSIIGQAVGVALAYKLFFPTTEQYSGCQARCDRGGQRARLAIARCSGGVRPAATARRAEHAANRTRRDADLPG
ncbi:MAG: MFS transporter, partial [Gammaproteobacteria bacterium]